MRNLFRFNFDKGVWMFGTNWLTDFIGGLFTLLMAIVLIPTKKEIYNEKT